MLSALQFLVDDVPPTSPLMEAVRAATLSVGRTAPNPPVGCVIVDDKGIVLARGNTEPPGKRHAEIVALDALAPSAATGTTAFTTLEPCSHHGRTPPCANRLIKERVARVVVGAVDPNPVVNGRGIALLREAGIAVDVIGDAWCQALYAPFATTLQKKRPYVILKVATSLDGKIATRTGSSRWITGPESRHVVHQLRDHVDAVITGSGTVLADDPALTVRDLDDSRSRRDPLRVILDRRARVPKSAKVFADDNVLVSSSSIADTLATLHARGLQTVMVEAGAEVAASFFSASLVDELWWFQAPIVVGGDGRSVFATLGVDEMNAASKLSIVTRKALGPDQLTIARVS